MVSHHFCYILVVTQTNSDAVQQGTAQGHQYQEADYIGGWLHIYRSFAPFIYSYFKENWYPPDVGLNMIKNAISWLDDDMVSFIFLTSSRLSNMCAIETKARYDPHWNPQGLTMSHVSNSTF